MTEKRYMICKYFDDVPDGIVAKNLTLEQAKEMIKKYSNGVYVSYEIKEED